MNRFQLFSCILVVCTLSDGIHATPISYLNTEKDYYWLDYTGTLPKDAVPGGTKRDGSVMYIGQAPFSESVLLPGEFDTAKNALLYAMNGDAHVVQKNVKILCSPYPENFEWIPTDLRSVRYMTEKHLIRGGFDDDYPLLIGRKTWNDDIVIGKVTINTQYQSIAFVANGKDIYDNGDFEVLSYNSELQTSSKVTVVSSTSNKTIVVESECAPQIKIINVY